VSASRSYESQVSGSRSRTAVPETFAMVDSRRVDDSKAHNGRVAVASLDENLLPQKGKKFLTLTALRYGD
jgi:hypothetical protein